MLYYLSVYLECIDMFKIVYLQPYVNISKISTNLMRLLATNLSSNIHVNVNRTHIFFSFSLSHFMWRRDKKNQIHFLNLQCYYLTYSDL